MSNKIKKFVIVNTVQDLVYIYSEQYVNSTIVKIVQPFMIGKNYQQITSFSLPQTLFRKANRNVRTIMKISILYVIPVMKQFVAVV